MGKMNDGKTIGTISLFDLCFLGIEVTGLRIRLKITF
jgi:hypothetical protein